MPYQTLQVFLNLVAFKILHGVFRASKPVRLPLCVQVNEGGVTVSIQVNPTGHALPERLPGRFLSDAERRVWDCLKPGEWAMGKEIAERVGRRYEDPKFKHCLQTLEEREVLQHEDGQGYRRAPLDG